MRVDRLVARTLLGLACALTTVWGKPVLSGSTLRAAGSLRIKGHTWAELRFRLRNPDDALARVTVRLVPRGQRNVTVYDVDLEVPARTERSYSTMVTVGTVEAYDVQLLYRDSLIQTDKGVPISLTQQRASNVVAINDNVDMGLGDLFHNEALRRQQLVSNIRAGDAPDHWASYGQTGLIVLLEPDFTRFSSRQQQAILQYVSRGGTLFFASPRGLMAAADSMLAEVLPVTPVRLRRTQTIREFEALGAPAVTWPHHVVFLDGAPLGDGITILEHEGAPLLRWRRYGLGKVGCCAANLGDKHFQKAHDGLTHAALWNHVCQQGGKLRLASDPGQPSTVEALGHVTGEKIPKPYVIQRLLVGYYVLLVVVIVLGAVRNRRLTSWLALGAVAVVSTAAVFAFAHAQRAHRPNRLAAIVSYRADGTPDASTEQVVSLFAKSRRQIGIVGPGPDFRLRSPAPSRPVFRGSAERRQRSRDWRVAADRGGTEVARDPLRITARDGAHRLDNLLLPANAPKLYAAVFANRGRLLTDLPMIRWEPGGPAFEDWTVPEGIPVDHAVLVGHRGVWPVQVRGRRVRLRSGADIANWTPPPEVDALRRQLVDGPAPAPFLAVFGDTAQDASSALPAEYAVIGRAVTLLPVRQDLRSGAVYLPPEHVAVELLSATSRILRINDEWQAVTENGARTYDVTACLPDAMNRLRIDELRVDFVGDNRGGNLDFTVELLRVVPGDVEPEVIAGEHDGQNTWRFPHVPEEGVVARADGQFILRLRVTPRQKVSPTAASRMNTWTVRRLDVAIRGTLPDANRGIF